MKKREEIIESTAIHSCGFHWKQFGVEEKPGWKRNNGKLCPSIETGFQPSTLAFPSPISVEAVSEPMWKGGVVYICGRCEPISFMLGFGQYHQGQTTHLYCAPYRDLAQPLPFSKTKKQAFKWLMSFKLCMIKQNQSLLQNILDLPQNYQKREPIS